MNIYIHFAREKVRTFGVDFFFALEIDRKNNYPE